MNVVVSTSVVQLSWGRTLSLGLDAISLWCSTERTLSGRFVSPAALQFLFVSPLCFQKAQSFCELIFALFVPRIYSLSSLSAISEQIGESPVCDVS